MRKKMKISIISRQMKNRSKYDPQTCNKEQEKTRRKNKLQKDNCV